MSGPDTGAGWRDNLPACRRSPRRRPASVPSSPPVFQKGYPPPPPAGPYRMTEAQFLAYERDPDRALEPQSELLKGGVVREVPNVRRPHDLVTGELFFAVRSMIDLDRFEAHTGDLKSRPRRCRVYCPDVHVTPCPPALLDDVGAVVTNAVFVAEVLSRSIEATDRGEKLDCYRNTPSVFEYWLLAQERVRVERHHRPDADASWDSDVYENRSDEVPLPALGGAVNLAKLYRQAVPA